MKCLGTIVVILFKLSVGFGQISPLVLKEGAFRNSIDWYIESTTNYVNSLTPEIKIKSLNQLGVVVLRFVNASDSVEEIKSGHLNGGIEFIHHPRFQFKILIEAKYYVTEHPPSHYFIHNGVLVCIYDGLELHTQFKEKDLDIFKRLVKQGKVIHMQAQKEYLVTIDDAFKNGFETIDLGQKED